MVLPLDICSRWRVRRSGLVRQVLSRAGRERQRERSSGRRAAVRRMADRRVNRAARPTDQSRRRCLRFALQARKPDSRQGRADRRGPPVHTLHRQADRRRRRRGHAHWRQPHHRASIPQATAERPRLRRGGWSLSLIQRYFVVHCANSNNNNPAIFRL